MHLATNADTTKCGGSRLGGLSWLPGAHGTALRRGRASVSVCGLDADGREEGTVLLEVCDGQSLASAARSQWFRT